MGGSTEPPEPPLATGLLMKGVSKLMIEHKCLRSEVMSYERCKFRLRVENFSNDDSGTFLYWIFNMEDFYSFF